MDVAAAVAVGTLLFRLMGYVIMSGRWVMSVGALVVIPLAGALVTALLLTWQFQPVIVAIALTEAACLVFFILELLKDYLMMRNTTTVRR